MTEEDFRRYVLPDENPRVGASRGLDPVTYSKPILATERAQALLAEWQRLYAAPFVGITDNGAAETGLYALEDEGFDNAPAIAAAQHLLATLNEEQRARIQYPIDAAEWRGWYNPEIVFNMNGIRLETVPDATRAAFLDLLASCTSPEGFIKFRHLMQANLFLGELYNLRNIMSDWTYHLLFFGTPSPEAPWGWSLYGHHVAINVLIIGRQMVISPVFMGVEPRFITLEDGTHFSLFDEEERLGLQLMQSLPPSLQERATIFKQMEDPAMPPERFNFADQRHLGGAFQDNRIIAPEGILATEFPAEQQALLLQLVGQFYSHWPEGPRQARIRQVARHLGRTYWSWIGGHGDDDPFYYHIHSPVVMLEFDHHSGMWLGNSLPAKFHVHIINRLPNGNDYGKELLRQYHESQPKAA